LFTAFDIRHATNTEYLDFPIFVFILILNLTLWSHFFNVITCPFSKTISCNKPDLNILFNNENIAIFVKMALTLVQGRGEEIDHNFLHTFVKICPLIQNLKKSYPSVNLWRSYRHFNMSKVLRFSIITPVKKRD
jgi:hypothetical protein